MRELLAKTHAGEPARIAGEGVAARVRAMNWRALRRPAPKNACARR